MLPECHTSSVFVPGQLAHSDFWMVFIEHNPVTRLKSSQGKVTHPPGCLPSAWLVSRALQCREDAIKLWHRLRPSLRVQVAPNIVLGVVSRQIRLSDPLSKFPARLSRTLQYMTTVALCSQFVLTRALALTWSLPARLDTHMCTKPFGKRPREQLHSVAIRQTANVHPNQ